MNEKQCNCGDCKCNTTKARIYHSPALDAVLKDIDESSKQEEFKKMVDEIDDKGLIYKLGVCSLEARDHWYAQFQKGLNDKLAD